MKSFKLAIAVGIFTLAQSVFALQPTSCNDGGVYRALNGSNVVTDAAKNKTLSIAGINIIECKVGNTTSCTGTSFNDYTCSVNFTQVSGRIGQQVAANIDFTDAKAHSINYLPLTHANSGDDCGHMNCFREDRLSCDGAGCKVENVLDGWDE